MTIELLPLLILAALQVKHWWVDFVNQTDEEVHSKGIYGNMVGIGHSVKHGALTYVILLCVLPVNQAYYIAIADIFLHYHIDWIKMNYGERDIKNKTFWIQLGLDQLAHQLCYILYLILFLLTTKRYKLKPIYSLFQHILPSKYSLL